MAKDVSSALEFRDAYNAIRSLDNDEKDTHLMSTPDGKQVVLIVNEPGLYGLILTSRKPEAKKFKRWIKHDVHPSIRKDGAYITKETLEEMLISPDFGILLLQEIKKEREEKEMRV